MYEIIWPVASDPQHRVLWFIEHWYQQWQEMTDLDVEEEGAEGFDFVRWRELIAEVDQMHFVAGEGCGSQNSFSSTAPFNPELETITECRESGTTAQVFTTLSEDDCSKYHVYDLVLVDEKDWRIASVMTLFYPPNDAVVAPEKHADILALSHIDAPLLPHDEVLQLNENTLFHADREVQLNDLDPAMTVVSEIGKLHVTSGVLGILDFGYDIYDFEPLERRVKPGEYRVEAVTFHDWVAGIRVRLNDTDTAVRWFAASTPNGDGAYGVDAGNLAIVDVENLLTLTNAKKESLFSRWCQDYQPQLLSMTMTNDAVITSTGTGDGTYPAFWGVNEAGEVVSLYIDFMILTEEGENGVYTSI
uniref:DUF4241 domain-containing protein n=1 Tax=Thaumasiovibrio occultus TaxID=1891184 RepID=UPI00192D149E|nr:DUF4241 domain-containing protein [Thaumasiovibrio occultus]